MNKIHLTLLASAAAMFFACGSQDGSPAELKINTVKISPFDTLTAEFDSKIILSEIEDGKNLEHSQSAAYVPSKDKASSKLRFVGTYDTTLGGLPYFKPDVEDSIVFHDLKNEDDYTMKSAVLTYKTHPILDSDDNSNEATAADIDSLGNVENTVIFAGVLDKNIGNDKYDINDFFKLKLKAGDLITITVGNFRDSLKVQFKDSTTVSSPVVDTTITATIKNLGTLILPIPYEMLSLGGDKDTEFPFYIKVFTESFTDTKPTPYTVSVLVAKAK